MSYLRKIYEKLIKKREKMLREIGYFTSLKYLNFSQKVDFLKSFFCGVIENEISLKGGRQYDDMTFFIIRRDGAQAGLFSLYITTAGWIDYAVKRGYIPVVDMSNYRNNYINKKKMGIDNSWEYFFEQPMKYDLRTAYSGKNVILSDMCISKDRPDQSMDFFTNKNGCVNKWKEVVRQYIRIRPTVMDELNKQYHDMIKVSELGVLGVLARGTDYVSLKPKNHPKMPSTEMLIEDAKKLMSTHAYGKVFLATEDETIYNQFKEVFGKMLIEDKHEYIKYDRGYICQKRNDREEDELLSGKEYLATIWKLSNCDSVLMGRTSGAVAAVLMSDKEWIYSRFYDLGEYA